MPATVNMNISREAVRERTVDDVVDLISRNVYEAQYLARSILEKLNGRVAADECASPSSPGLVWRLADLGVIAETTVATLSDCLRALANN